jgi:GNAT superfamily N-acetyltransferase
MIAIRSATPTDAASLAVNVTEGFESYRAWAPEGWAAPVVEQGAPETLARTLARPDVWLAVAVSDREVIGHVALALSTREDRGPPPPGTVFIWQLFVRAAWRGHGVATELMRAAVAEAEKRGFSYMRLWTPAGAGRARRFYEREGWTLTGRVHRHSDIGLPTVEYGCNAVSLR